MTRALRDNGLSLVMASLFLLFLVGHAIAGFHEHNNQQQQHGQPPDRVGAYLASGDFWESVFENWESEFLQMAAYVLLTAFLYQKGSSESKDPDKQEPVDEDPRLQMDNPRAPLPVRQGGWRLKMYEHSLSAAFTFLFLVSWAGHAVGGAAHYNEDRLQHGELPVSLGAYISSAKFWFESFQNWQSEFLAVLSIVVLSIWLRERGSPESKPVAAPHHETGD